MENDREREWASSELPFDSVSKRVFVRNHACENVFRIQVHFHANLTHFHKKGFG